MDRTKNLKLALAVAAAFGLGAGTMWSAMREPEPPKGQIPPGLAVAADSAEGDETMAAKPTSKKPTTPKPVIGTPVRPKPPKPPRPVPVGVTRPARAGDDGGKTEKPKRHRPPTG